MTNDTRKEERLPYEKPDLRDLGDVETMTEGIGKTFTLSGDGTMVTLMDTPEAEQNQPGVGERVSALEKERASLLEELKSLRARLKVLEAKRK